MSIQPLRSTSPRVSPLPERVTPVASSSDPSQSIAVDGNGVVRVAGVARGDDGGGSEVRLSFDGALVSVALREGMTAVQTFRLLEKVMPDGYRLNPLTPVVNPDGDVRGEILRRPVTRRLDLAVASAGLRRLPSSLDVFTP